MKVIGVIPARYASTRLPGKPLTNINGKPLIKHVWEAAKSAKSLSEVYIATDNARVMSVAESFGAKVIMTPPELPSGTDRIHFAVNSINIDADIIVNIQGDEPLITGLLIDSLVEKFLVSSADVATLIKKINCSDELWDTNIVKVTLRNDSTALYFSRTAIPFLRDEMFGDWLKNHAYYKHIGIYAYKKHALNRFAELPESDLEIAEKLEQLRLLQDGATYLCVETDSHLIGVDTPEDVIKVTHYLKEHTTGY